MYIQESWVSITKYWIMLKPICKGDALNVLILPSLLEIINLARSFQAHPTKKQWYFFKNSIPSFFSVIIFYYYFVSSYYNNQSSPPYKRQDCKGDFLFHYCVFMCYVQLQCKLNLFIYWKVDAERRMSVFSLKIA